MTEIIRMQGADGEGMELKKYEEILFPNLDSVDPARELCQGVMYKDDDIVMSTFPKTGYHWVANMLWKMKTMDESKRPQDTLLEFGPPKVFVGQEDPRLIFSHFKPYRLLPTRTENMGKAVLMLRNPKDAMVSNYYYLKNSSLLKNKQTWDEFFQSYIHGEVHFGSYFVYLRQWEQVLKDIADGNSNLQVEVIYYGDFLLKPKENIVRLNKLLGFNRDQEYLDRVLKETTLN